MMRRSLVATATILFTCCASFAQQAGMPGTSMLGTSVLGTVIPGTSTPDMSAMPPSASSVIPSPTGAMGVDAPIGGAGIPLATTELFAGGLSPSPTDVTAGPTCPGAGANPGVGALGTGSIFGANGTLATSTSDLASSGDPTDSGCGAAASAGAGPLGVTSTLGTAPAFAGGGVPLGASALGTTGLAGTIGVPIPGSLSPCSSPGSLAATGIGLPIPSSPVPGITSASSC
jgi:hypothetical protein